MKKILVAAALAAVLAAPVMAAEASRGGPMGFIHGCCFGLRGAAAYNDGKAITAIEWIDRFLLLDIYAAVRGWQGVTTSDLRTQFGPNFF